MIISQSPWRSLRTWRRSAIIRCALPPGSWVTRARRDSRPSKNAPQLVPRDRCESPPDVIEKETRIPVPLRPRERSRPATSLPLPPQRIKFPETERSDGFATPAEFPGIRPPLKRVLTDDDFAIVAAAPSRPKNLRRRLLFVSSSFGDALSETVRVLYALVSDSFAMRPFACESTARIESFRR